MVIVDIFSVVQIMVHESSGTSQGKIDVHPRP